jgi:3-hydroxyisobutyrate dehydrogenase-like beta-hydroxyacid dehydrogenase
MLCLANTEAVREVVFGPGVSLSKAGLGRCWWIFSSLEPTATREMAAELKRVAVCVGSMLVSGRYAWCAAGQSGDHGRWAPADIE